MYTTDSARKRVFPVKKVRDAGVVQKKLVASFSGTAYAAERDGDTLNIYLMTTDPVPTGASMDGKATVSDSLAHIRAGAAKMEAFAANIKAQDAELRRPR